MNIDERTAELTQRHVDGLLSAPQRQELETLLRDHAAAREAYLRELRMHAALCISLHGTRGFSSASDADAECPDSRQGVYETRGRTIRFTTWRWLALAASVAIVAGVWWFTQRPGGTSPSVAMGLRVTEVQGTGCRVQGSTFAQGAPEDKSGGQSVPVVVGMELREGDRVVVKDGGKVGLKYDGEETQIELMGATQASFGSENGSKRVNLAGGTLVCTVAPQPADRPMLLVTPQAVARVLGTRFTLEADAEATRIEVTAGLVRMTRATDKASVDVPAGHKATVSSVADPQVEPIRAQGQLFGLDFEDQKLPEGSSGTVVEGPRAANSRFCVAGVRAKSDRLYRVNIRNGNRALLTYREDAVLSFDYWVKKYTGAIDVYFWNSTRSISRGFVIQAPAQEQWTHVTKRLSDCTEELRNGDLIWDLNIQTTPGGNELFVDNICIETKEEP